MNIGEKIKKLRIDAGYTQEELATAIGTTKQTIYKYENGIITDIPPSKLKALSEKLNTTYEYLLNSNISVNEQLSKEEFALYGEVRDLTDEEKKKVLDFIKFTKSQRGE